MKQYLSAHSNGDGDDFLCIDTCEFCIIKYVFYVNQGNYKHLISSNYFTVLDSVTLVRPCLHLEMYSPRLHTCNPSNVSAFYHAVNRTILLCSHLGLGH